MKETDKQFNKDLLLICEEAMKKSSKNCYFDCDSIIDIVEVAIEKCNLNSGLLDVKKVQV